MLLLLWLFLSPLLQMNKQQVKKIILFPSFHGDITAEVLSSIWHGGHFSLFSSLTVPFSLGRDVWGYRQQQLRWLLLELTNGSLLGAEYIRPHNSFPFSFPKSQFPSVMIMSLKDAQWKQFLSSMKTHSCWLFKYCYLPAKGTVSLLFLVGMPISIFHENTVVKALLLGKIWENLILM